MSENAISTPMEFKNYKVFRYTLAGRPLVVETGKLAGLANGSCLIRYGETAILCFQFFHLDWNMSQTLFSLRQYHRQREPHSEPQFFSPASHLK